MTTLFSVEERPKREARWAAFSVSVMGSVLDSVVVAEAPKRAARAFRFSSSDSRVVEERLAVKVGGMAFEGTEVSVEGTASVVAVGSVVGAVGAGTMRGMLSDMLKKG